LAILCSERLLENCEFVLQIDKLKLAKTKDICIASRYGRGISLEAKSVFTLDCTVEICFFLSAISIAQQEKNASP